MYNTSIMKSHWQIEDISMKGRFNIFFNELRAIKSIDLVCESKSILEKLFWMVIGITGTIWAAYFITLQV